jgi:hypothetical protein
MQEEHTAQVMVIFIYIDIYIYIYVREARHTKQTNSKECNIIIYKKLNTSCCTYHTHSTNHIYRYMVICISKIQNSEPIKPQKISMRKKVMNKYI